jgi:hypothetical protein
MGVDSLWRFLEEFPECRQDLNGGADLEQKIRGDPELILLDAEPLWRRRFGVIQN